MAEEKNEDYMSPNERLTWLRDRGVMIETPEERKAKQITKLMHEEDEEKETVSFVLIPHDTSKPLRELAFEYSIGISGGDALLEHLAPMFSAMSSDKEVDLELFRGHAIQTFGSSDAPREVSEDTLKQVAAQGSVEKFALVHPTASNHFTGVNIYLDEVGMLKRLPLNTRASDYAARAGYNPAPQFYGNVFLGRIKAQPVLQNVSLALGKDTAMDAPWLLQATIDNLEYQTDLNKITGRNDVQEAVDGTEGKEKNEEGYTWTQTEEELEVVLPLPFDAISREVSVKFMPQSIQAKYGDKTVLSLELFERVDPDGCTWTLDRSGENIKLVATLEKTEEALWPRIKD